MPSHAPGSPLGGGTATNYRPAIFAMGYGHQVGGVACASCPAAIWYQDDELHCFCNIFKDQMGAPGRKPVVACDGRESAIAQWEQAQKKL